MTAKRREAAIVVETSMVSFGEVERRRDGVGRVVGIALTSVLPLVDAIGCWFRGSMEFAKLPPPMTPSAAN